MSEDGKKIKTTRKIRTVVKKEHVNPAVAERREWTKFGLEKGHPRGPDLTTTSIGENIVFKPSINWKASQKEESAEDAIMKDQLRDKKVTCRICKGDHFTARCPFKDTLKPLDEVETPGGAAGAEEEEGPGGLGLSKGAYVAPHLRNKGAGGGDKMGGRERDDFATLRVTNVSEMAEENDLRAMFERFGRVTRVFLAKDKETGRAKGFAFVSFVDRADAARACEKMDGRKYTQRIVFYAWTNSPSFRRLRASHPACRVCQTRHLNVSCNKSLFLR